MDSPAMVDRRRLRARLESANPAIVCLYAPAGYGKSAFIAQTFLDEPGALLCDCTGLRDDLDLARRLFPSMSDVLSDGARTAAERLDLALQRFGSLESGTVIFERARFISRHSAAAEFFARLLEERPPNVRVVISAREPLPLRLTRFASPHEIVGFRADDLAFDDEEIRSLFTPYVTDTASLRRIREVSEGWPIALFLLLRFSKERRIAPLLDRLHDVAFVELHEYLNDEVVATFDRPTTEALFACAALPEPTDADVRDAFTQALSGDALAAFAKESPFLHRDQRGQYRVHPLLAALLLEHQEERRALILSQLALARESEGKFVRAAELFAASGNADASARVLAHFDIFKEDRPPARFLRVLDSLDASRLQQYPHLWGISALVRLFRGNPQALLDEADSVWRTISPDRPLRERYAIFVLRIALMSYLGQLSRAHLEIETMLARSPGPRLRRNLFALRACVLARSGRIGEAQLDVEGALPSTLQGDAMAAAVHVTLAADIARVRGDRMEVQFLERGLQRAQAAAIDSSRALVLAQLCVSNWLCGDGRAAVRTAETLRELVDRGFVSFRYLASALLGREAAAAADDLPEFVIYGQLIELANTRDERRRDALARNAYANSAHLGLPFLETLSALAIAFAEPSAFDDYVAIAAEHAATIDSPELHGALEAVAQRRSDCGMLGGFVSQLSREYAEVQSPIEVSLAGGSVRVDGEIVEVGGRELELLLAIAQRREATSRSRLAALMWPDLDEAAARNAFSVCLHRLRARLPRKDAIEREGEGYRLHAHAAVDLWELERMLGKSQKGGLLAERDRSALERIWHGIRQEPPIRAEQWEWFQHVATRLRESRVELAHALGDDALERRDVAAALRYASDALERDPCDERAAEIAIRAHLISGDRAAAMRSYRQYRAALHAELGAEPSFSLTALVTTA